MSKPNPRPNPRPNPLVVVALHVIRAWDRLRLAFLAARHPGLEIHPGASTNLASSEFNLAPSARLTIGAGVTTERRTLGVHFELGADAEVIIEDNVWLRSDVGPVFLRAYPGARIRIGSASQLSACMLSAKQEITVGRRVLIGMGARIFDSDQHAIDLEHPEVTLPVRIEDHAWIAADVTVLRGTTIGNSSVVGTRSLVRGIVEPHTVVSGVPAKLYGKVGDRASLPD
jgi:carbonic anhydrase/acetyltransferase-like protein (isoleucine patch superfamily)